MKKCCNDCKYSPENLVFADTCNKKIEYHSGPGEITEEFVDIWDSNHDGNCPYYKRNFIKLLKDLFI